MLVWFLNQQDKEIRTIKLKLPKYKQQHWTLEIYILFSLKTYWDILKARSSDTNLLGNTFSGS